MGDYLKTEGLRQVLNAIKERFSKKEHKHTVGDISDLKLVAKTGKYSDLSGLPTIPSVAVAKRNKVGLVMPGDGIVVSDTGALSINVDKESGLYIEDNLLKASFMGGESHSIKISAEKWVEIYQQLLEVIKENNFKKISDYTVVLKNTYFGKTVSIKFDEEKLSNFESIHKYAFEVMDFSNFPKSDSFAEIGGYAKDIDDLKFYEFFKLLSSDEISDAVEVFLYNYVNPSRAKEQIGKYLQDIILVYDELERFKQLGIYVDENLNNIVTTYVYNKDESGTNYIPLSLYLGSYTPEPETKQYIVIFKDSKHIQITGKVDNVEIKSGNSIEEGKKIELTAVVEPGYKLVEWLDIPSGATISNNGLTVTFILNKDVTITPKEDSDVVPKYSVKWVNSEHIEITGTANDIEITSEEEVDENSKIELTAIVLEGYRLIEWINVPEGSEISEDKTSLTFVINQDIKDISVVEEEESEVEYSIVKLTKIQNINPTEVQHTLTYVGGENESIEVNCDTGKISNYTIYEYIDDDSEYNSRDYIKTQEVVGNQFDINFKDLGYKTYVIRLLFNDDTEAYYHVNKTENN
jgi:hypothetical protein